MDDQLNFQTYLFISPKKIVILVNTESNDKLYEKELIFKKISKNLDHNILDNFLNENIFKIEKILNNFIKNICVIIDCEEFFSAKISIKKNNYGELIKRSNLNYILNEARDQCSNTLKDMKIIHFLIDNYFIDEKKYLHLPQNLKCNNFSLDINFICLPLDYIKNLEQIFKKYQISIDRFISKRYMEDLFSNTDMSSVEMTREIMAGYNLNEVVLEAKKLKNSTFFEKFFHFFS